MKKNYHERIKQLLFLWLVCCLFFIQASAKVTGRYIKETFSDNTIIKYEVFYPAYWEAFSNLTDAEVSARMATRDGFVSVNRDLQKKTFLLVLEKEKSTYLVTKVMFDFKPDEIKSYQIQQNK